MASKPADATLLDVLIDGFEKNEMLFGFHRRMLATLEREGGGAPMRGVEGSRNQTGGPWGHAAGQSATVRLVAGVENVERRSDGSAP